MSLEVGQQAPNFELSNANPSFGETIMTFAKVKKENGTIIVFECNHCPYVVASISRMNAMADFCAHKNIGFAGINSNDPIVYENDSFEHMVKRAEKGMPYPYLHDETQEVAHAYDAKRTPEFFLFDAEDTLVYRGRMDDNPKNPQETTTSELMDAVNALLEGNEPAVQFTESIGCSVKWKV
ncbi:MAG: thioredoxin family protein [archaeon]|nr:thioredoxin family protein [archaeon]MDA1167352.1 thioredoxin family protein [archaeon]